MVLVIPAFIEFIVNMGYRERFVLSGMSTRKDERR